jgi:DNA-binding PadR family transcriptional regulator
MPRPSDVQKFLPLSPQQFHILLSLSEHSAEGLHGYGLILDIAERTGQAMRLGTGTLYTAIARLEDLELVAESSTDDRRRFYRITPLGKSVLSAETERLETLVRYARGKRAVKAAR